MAETFKKAWLRGWVTSSQGFRVRLLGRTNLQYEDSLGQLHLFAEPQGGPGPIHVLVYTAAVPDEAARPKSRVVDDVVRAFESRGWIVELQD